MLDKPFSYEALSTVLANLDELSLLATRRGGEDADGGGGTSAMDGGAPDGSSAAPLLDPEAPGASLFDERDAKATVASTGDGLELHVAVPRGAGRHPLVVVAHGFQIAPSAQRVA